MNEQHSRTLLVCGAIAAGSGVAIGAWGAHGLRTVVAPDMLATFETAVRYQMYHSIATLIAGVVIEKSSSENVKWIVIAGWCFIIGILLFSGSLYLLVLLNQRWFGVITPVGGISFIAGWIALAISLARRK